MHVPKTVIAESPPHAGHELAPGQGLLTFCAVREPFAWYESFWRYRMKNGWMEYETEIAHSDFSCFLQNVLDHWPDHYTSILKYYITDETILMRTSHLREDLKRVLLFVGEDFDPSVIDDTPVINQSLWPRQEASDSLFHQIRDQNTFALELLDELQN